jgi:hypothetical protein
MLRLPLASQVTTPVVLPSSVATGTTLPSGAFRNDGSTPTTRQADTDPPQDHPRSASRIRPTFGSRPERAGQSQTNPQVVYGEKALLLAGCHPVLGDV